MSWGVEEKISAMGSESGGPILSRSRSLPTEEYHEKPPLIRSDSVLSWQAKDSGIASDQPSDLQSSDLPSGFNSDLPEECPQQVNEQADDDKKDEEGKQATIKQHYYPEGGWGWVVVFCALVVQILSHGLHMAYGVIMQESFRRFSQATFIESGKIRTLLFIYNNNNTSFRNICYEAYILFLLSSFIYLFIKSLSKNLYLY